MYTTIWEFLKEIISTKQGPDTCFSRDMLQIDVGGEWEWSAKCDRDRDGECKCGDPDAAAATQHRPQGRRHDVRTSGVDRQHPHGTHHPQSMLTLDNNL